MPHTEPPTLPWRVELEPAEVAARFRWARRQGHPQYLWPEVPPTAWRTSLDELERVTRRVLTGGRAELAGGGESGSRALGVAGFTSGVGPLVGHWIEAGRVDGDDLTARVFLLHLWHGRARGARQAAEAARSVGLLRAAGIEAVVVKSAHTAVRYFPEPGTRAGADVDLVVASAEYGLAERALVRGGYVREGGQRSPRKTDLRPGGVAGGPKSLELAHGKSVCGVDLHDSLTRDFFGVRRVTLGDALAASESPRAGASPGIRVLRQPTLLAYHALHTSEGLENLTLIRLVELVLMIRRDREAGLLDWDDFLELLEAAGGLRFAYPAMALTERLVRGTVASRVLRRMEEAATPRMRRVLDGLRPADAQRLESLSLEERFMWGAGPLEHVRRVGHMLVPAPTALSPRRIAGKYRERLYRLTRLRVGVRRQRFDQSDG